MAPWRRSRPSASRVIGIALSAWKLQPVEFEIALAVWALGILAGLFPAMMAYRLSVMDTLVGE